MRTNWKKWALIIVSAIFLFLLPEKVSYAQNSTSNSPEIIVVFKKKPTVSILSAFSNSATQNLEIKNSISSSNAMVFTVPTGDVKTVMENVAKDPTVSAVFPNYKLSLYNMPNDQYIAATPAPGLPRVQWNMFNLNLAATGNSAWDVTKGSADVVIAVIDTGINSTHPDFAGKFTKLVDCIASPCTEVSSMNDNFPGGHGTHVAGLAGAATNNGDSAVPSGGIASAGYNTKLMIIRVMDANGQTTTDSFLNGVRWAADHGAKVINSSFGIVEDSITPEAINEFNSAVAYAWGKGAVFVAAAGNCRGNTNGRKGCEVYPNGDITKITGYAQNSKVYPAASPNVISVAATLADNSMASYSEQNDSTNNNLKNWVDVAAPGGDGNCSDATKSCIYSTVPTNQYGWDSGTSMASPEVAGVAALVFAANPGLTNAQVKNIIETTANHSVASGVTNFGLVDALAAVNAAAATAANTPTPSPTGAAISTTPNLTPSPTPSVTPILTIAPSLSPTVAVTTTPAATPTTGPTATPTITPYPTTGVSSLLPKTPPNSFQSAPFCPQTVTGVSYNSGFTGLKNIFSFKNLLIKQVFASSNIALGKTTNASGNYYPSRNAVDGDLGDMWNSGSYAPQWVEVDLGSEQTVGEIKLYVIQLPNGQTTHEIWVADSSHNYNTKIDTISGSTADGQVLDKQYNPAITNARYVKVLTTQSPSWVAWKEIEVYGPDQISVTPTVTPTPTNTPQPTATPTSIPPSPTITSTNPTSTPIPTVTPGGPTSTPVPTVTPGGPSMTPVVPPNMPGVCPAKSKGDANCDGKIDDADYKIWLTQFDTMVSESPVNQNANYACVEGNSQTYFVDLSDFEVWRRNAALSSLFLPVNPAVPTPGTKGSPCLNTNSCSTGLCCSDQHGICEAQTSGITCKSGTAGSLTPAPTVTAQSCTSNVQCGDGKDDPLNWFCDFNYTHTCYHEKERLEKDRTL